MSITMHTIQSPKWKKTTKTIFCTGCQDETKNGVIASCCSKRNNGYCLDCFPNLNPHTSKCTTCNGNVKIKITMYNEKCCASCEVQCNRYKLRLHNNTKKELCMTNTNLTMLATEISMYTNISVLNLSNNKLYDLPIQLLECKALQNLDLSINLFDNIPDVVYNLYTLNKLDLSWNLIHNIDRKISNMVSLENLDLSHNNIRWFLVNLTEIPNLVKLNLSHNFIMTTTLQNIIMSFDEKLTKLTNLDISHNRLTSIRYLINFIKNVKYLDISSNCIKNIFLLSTLSNLETLDFRSNQVTNTKNFSRFWTQIPLKLKYIFGSNNPLITGVWNKNEFIELKKCDIPFIPSSYDIHRIHDLLKSMSPGMEKVVIDYLIETNPKFGMLIQRSRIF